MKFSTKYYLLDEEAMHKLAGKDKKADLSPILKDFNLTQLKENTEKKNLVTSPHENTEKKNLETSIHEFGSPLEPISTVAIDQIEPIPNHSSTSNLSSHQINLLPEVEIKKKKNKKKSNRKRIFK